MRRRHRFAAGLAGLVTWVVSVTQGVSAEPPTAGAASAGPSVDAATLERALGRYRREPPVDEVVRLTLQAARRDPDRASSLRTRARVRGLVPVVRVGARRGEGQDLSAYQTVDDDRTNVSSGSDLTLQGWATFSLDRLVFAPEETSIWREERADRAQERELIRVVVTLYFERRRLQLERDLLGEASVAHALRIREIGALLNAFTGGAFLRIINGR